MSLSVSLCSVSGFSVSEGDSYSGCDYRRNCPAALLLLHHWGHGRGPVVHCKYIQSSPSSPALFLIYSAFQTQYIASSVS